MYRKSFFLLTFVLGAGVCLRAQDTTKRKTIEITSSFKPVLREAVKINFNAAPPQVDTSRPRLTYNIPAQYLFLTYQPSEMKPVAFQGDTMRSWENYNYIKIGVGNVHFPFIRTGFTFGDEKTSQFNIFANHLSSKGSLPSQKNSLTDVKLMGTVKTSNKLEWNGSLGFKNDAYYLYGYRPDTLKFAKEDLRQFFQTFEGRLSLRNTEPTEYGLSYRPNIKVSVFSDNHSPKASEANTVLNLPLEKTFGKTYGFNLAFTADLTNYRPAGDLPNQNNNVFLVTPAFLVKTANLYLQASVVPSWDNKQFNLLPNFIADISTTDQRFGIQLGWIGYYDKGSYQRYESINPWLAQPGVLLNTRATERYAGFKGSLDKHFSYSAKVGFNTFKNMPLFVNDTLANSGSGGKQFDVLYESSLETLQVHGELSYMQGEQFSATASLNYTQFHKLHTEPKAWGLLPLELNANLKWQAFKDFWAKVDLFAFDGAKYRASNGEDFKGDGAFDLNAGVEFRITRQLNLWVQMNNLFNKKYERWHQYPVYGFNILGGIVFSFSGK
jgi:hypothetical protein